MAEPADALVLGSRAFELLLTARTVDAEEALRLGLVAAVTEPGTPALDRALELADTLCGYSPFGVAMTKEVMWSNLDVLARPPGGGDPQCST